MAPDGRSRLIQQLETSNAIVSAASSCRELGKVLAVHIPDMLFTDEQLCDGDWRNVLDAVAGVGAATKVVICTDGRGGVSLWLDALESGAYDLLVEPLHSAQVAWMLRGLADRVRMPTQLVGPRSRLG